MPEVPIRMPKMSMTMEEGEFGELGFVESSDDEGLGDLSDLLS